MRLRNLYQINTIIPRHEYIVHDCAICPVVITVSETQTTPIFQRDGDVGPRIREMSLVALFYLLNKEAFWNKGGLFGPYKDDPQYKFYQQYDDGIVEEYVVNDL